MKNSLQIISVIVASLLLTLTFSCKKEIPKVLPLLTTTAINSITSTTAMCGGSITNDGGAAVTARGVCWSLNQNPTTSDSKTSDGSGIGTYTSGISGLTPGTTYNMRAYATNSVGTAYGNQLVSTTMTTLPTISTTAVTNITSSTATSGGFIQFDGGSLVTARGVCWSTSQNPTIDDNKTNNGTGSSSFISSITGLSPGTTYYIRSYASNSMGTAYGNQILIQTLALLPSVLYQATNSITQNSITCAGFVTSDGGSPVTSRGVCWSTIQNPTISNNKTIDGYGTGSFASSITGLAYATKYYIRAYAINSIGAAYANQVEITTLALLPSVTTTTINPITSNTASCGGNVTSDGGAMITSRGVCWSTSQNPTTSNNKTSDGSGIGEFTSNMTGLIANITYYVRAYATNSAGTAYGSENNIVLFLNSPGPNVTDIDGNVYHSVKIGSQIWTVENYY